MRCSSPEEVWAVAYKAAMCDYKMALLHGSSLNPFCTAGARSDWKRGFNNEGQRSYESPNVVLYDTIYLRGKAAALILRNETARALQLCQEQ